jgi:hypothetical protein
LPLLAACGFALLFAGCKDKPTTGGIAKHDPLFGNGRIPPQNVPVPDRGSAAGNKAKPFDPLMTPVGKDSKVGSAGYTEDPQRWKGGPFVPGSTSVPAALAGRTKDGEDLKIDDPKGVPLRPAGGMMPAGDADLAASADVQLQQLREYGVAKGSYSFSRENGSIIFRANVPNPTTGATQGFTGSGATPGEAVKQVLDQVKASRK